ncbi:hypothetical protein [uncultured Alistipes sp.]|uniref:hypothetical protein n=1 Tax=uncultured Alistipes sp. TaxID=538949 RepID=UPI00272CFCEF|nr:hypothetical protein [uncultured Alistipes sp.]
MRRCIVSGPGRFGLLIGSGVVVRRTVRIISDLRMIAVSPDCYCERCFLLSFSRALYAEIALNGYKIWPFADESLSLRPMLNLSNDGKGEIMTELQ